MGKGRAELFHRVGNFPDGKVVLLMFARGCGRSADEAVLRLAHDVVHFFADGDVGDRLVVAPVFRAGTRGRNSLNRDSRGIRVKGNDCIFLQLQLHAKQN